MKKALIFLLILVLGALIGGLYGIIHDQLTYTISHEYYTKFKFFQFGFADFGDEAILPNPRLYVAIVGFLATWWMGLPIGIILGLVGFIHPTHKQMFSVTLKTFGITTLVAFLTGLIGLAYGLFFISGIPEGWWVPDNLVDVKHFVAVGSMHNFSYLGGLPGLIAGIIYSVGKRKTLISAS